MALSPVDTKDVGGWLLTGTEKDLHFFDDAVNDIADITKQRHLHHPHKIKSRAQYYPQCLPISASVIKLKDVDVEADPFLNMLIDSYRGTKRTRDSGRKVSLVDSNGGIIQLEFRREREYWQTIKAFKRAVHENTGSYSTRCSWPMNQTRTFMASKTNKGRGGFLDILCRIEGNAAIFKFENEQITLQ